MTTFSRFCSYVDAAHKIQLPQGSTYSQVVVALADGGFLGTTAGELETLAKHMRSFTSTRQERTTLLKETVELMRRYGIADSEFSSSALIGNVRTDDTRAQTVIYDLREFEQDLGEAARHLGKAVPPPSLWDVKRTADNAFAWVYALRCGMLDPTPTGTRRR